MQAEPTSSLNIDWVYVIIPEKRRCVNYSNSGYENMAEKGFVVYVF